MITSLDMQHLLALTLDEQIPFDLWHQEIRLALADITAEETGEEFSQKIRELPEGKQERLCLSDANIQFRICADGEDVELCLLRAATDCTLFAGSRFVPGDTDLWRRLRFMLSRATLDEQTDHLWYPPDYVRADPHNVEYLPTGDYFVVVRPPRCYQRRVERHRGIRLRMEGHASSSYGTIFVREWAQSDIRKEAYDLACGIIGDDK